MTPTSRNTIEVGRYAVLHESHPDVPGLQARMTIPNPEFVEAENQGFSTRGIPETLELWERVGRTIKFPRAVVNPYLNSSHYAISDQTVAGEPSDIRSLIALRGEQPDWVAKLEAALRGSYGAVGQAVAGFGKTVGALELTARLQTKTLIIVHKEFLMTQWVKRILGSERAAVKLNLPASSKVEEPFLDLEVSQVGIVQQDRCEWEGKAIVVAMAQSLLARDYGQAFYESFGLVIVDECHRFAAPTFQQCITLFPAAKRFGVTATPERKDGLHDIFFGHIGKIAAVGDVDRLAPRINFVRTPVVVTAPVRESLKRRGRDDMNKTLEFLVNHEARNRQIVKMMARAAEKGRKVLILSHRRAHLDTLRDLFLETCRNSGLAVSTAYYVGGMKVAAPAR